MKDSHVIPRYLKEYPLGIMFVLTVILCVPWGILPASYPKKVSEHLGMEILRFFSSSQPFRELMQEVSLFMRIEGSSFLK